MSRYENAGPVTYVAKREFVDSFVQNYDFKDFANNKIYDLQIPVKVSLFGGSETSFLM